MTTLYGDRDKFGATSAFPLVEAVHGLVQEKVRRRWAESGLSWAEFVFGAGHELVSAEDLLEVEASVLATGYRFDWSAAVSVAERPDIYRGGADTAVAEYFEYPEAPSAPPDAAGWAQCGIGDNVVRRPADTTGTALFIRNTAQVLELLSAGIAPGTVAVIDDSGGTLTAPILERFHAVICAGGTTRSHLGILTREYGIPCLMNAKVAGLRSGDQVRIESSATARAAEDYQSNTEVTARIWRRPAETRLGDEG
jgi:phosphohistidine swiveling domain-containing protein